ncbi:MAG: nitroreductase family protein, partial [Oscillospiraceae bacterium]
MVRNEVIDTILARRSIRGFKKDPVPKEMEDTILECGRHAP